MTRTMILAAMAVTVGGCQTPATTPPARPTLDAAAPVERLTWPYRASYEVDMLRGAAQDRRIRIAVSCGYRPETWGARASELVGRGMGRTLSLSQLSSEEINRLRLVGAAMRAQAHYLAGLEIENYGMVACTNFAIRHELEQLTGYLQAIDAAVPR